MDESDDGFEGHRPQQVRVVIDAGAGNAPLVPIEIKNPCTGVFPKRGVFNHGTMVSLWPISTSGW